MEQTTTMTKTTTLRARSFTMMTTTATRARTAGLALLAGLTLAFAPACVVEHGGGWEEDPGDTPPGGPVLTPPGGPVNGDGDGDGDGTPGEGNGNKQPQLPGDDPEPDTAPEPDATPEPDAIPEEPTMMESARGNLVWKRYRQVERDLMRALELTKDQVCNELGQFNCVDVVHLAPLGGNEPFDQGQYEAVGAPTASTPIAVDRVVLSACVARVEEDMSNNPEVFTDIDLNAANLSMSGDSAAIDATVTTLYRRFLSRNPTQDELDTARPLGDGVSGQVFAKTACYAVGTTVENLFY